MYRQIIATFLVAFATSGVAHEMTPTYPQLETSHVNGIVKAKMAIFNRRQDVQFYEIGVFDEEWQPIPFVSSYKLIHLAYLGHLQFDVYIRQKDAARATYVCSKSRVRDGDSNGTTLASKICSKFKH